MVFTCFQVHGPNDKTDDALMGWRCISDKKIRMRFIMVGSPLWKRHYKYDFK
jgi:hypothetical protein